MSQSEKGKRHPQPESTHAGATGADGEVWRVGTGVEFITSNLFPGNKPIGFGMLRGIWLEIRVENIYHDETKTQHHPISFPEAQRRRELARARLAELELRKRAGQLVEVAKVEQLYFERGRQIRDSLMGIQTDSQAFWRPSTIRSRSMPL